MISNKETYIWCCDFNSYRGEGILARSFVEYLSKYKKKIIIQTFDRRFIFQNNKYKNDSKFKNEEKINLSIFEKYAYPIIGIIWLWINYFKKKEIIYLNFNPLWNIFIFIFSPPGTSFGPITGSIYDNDPKNIPQIVRKYFFPLFYKIGLFFLFKRKKKILFSTSLLKKIIPRKKLGRCIFDFQINYYKKLLKHNVNKNKRNIDIIYYHRNHSSKQSKVLNNILKEISKKFKVVVIGDFFKEKNLKNLNLISKKRTNKIILKSKFTFAAPENIFSMFTLECLSLNTKIFYDKKQSIIKKFFLTKNLIPINFSNHVKALRIIKNNLNMRYKSDRVLFNNKTWKKKIKDFDEYFLSC
jgi:hypothetical protein